MMRLSDSISAVKYINEVYSKKLHKLGIFSVLDLITYFPKRYVDTNNILTVSEVIKNINNMNLNSDVIVYGQIQNFKNTKLKNRKSIQTGLLTDVTINYKYQLKFIFFNQDFLMRVMKNSDFITITGKIKKSGNSLIINAKKFEKFNPKSEKSIHIGTIVPEYNLTKGISAKWLRNRINYVLNNLDPQEFKKDKTISLIEDTLGIDILDLIKKSHFGGDRRVIEESVEHLSNIELIHLALKTIASRKHLSKKRNIFLNNLKSHTEKSLELIPFKLTDSQQLAIKNICKLLTSDKQANILLQGDVGSGKTAVALVISCLYVFNKYKVIYLAPTTILSEQIFEFFNSILSKVKVKIGLLNSAKAVNVQNSQIIIGTTSLLNMHSLSKTGLLIVDEQHKFGVKQREIILKTQQETAIDFLSMTATPIPRTIAEGLFGNLEIISLTQKPGNRKLIKTYIVYSDKKLDFENWINHMLEKKSQIFWVCPNVESDSKGKTSAKTKYKEILHKFPDYKSDIIHGKTKEEEKQKIIERFKNRETSILISTSLVEVGIDIPNANIMIIENPESFGLASLHQIRGRVGRNDNENFCFLLPGDNISDKAKERIEFFAREHNGIKIAEYDLRTRGPGEVYGENQSGIPKLKIAKYDNIQTIRKSMFYAKNLYKNFGIEKINLFE